MSTQMGLTKPEEHLCPVHGVTQETFRVTLEEKSPKVDEVYCLRCVRNFLRGHFEPLKPVMVSVESPEEEKNAQPS